jgi:hypothetical protein
MPRAMERRWSRARARGLEMERGSVPELARPVRAPERALERRQARWSGER